jgi:hypothetical protein
MAEQDVSGMTRMVVKGNGKGMDGVMDNWIDGLLDWWIIGLT